MTRTSPGLAPQYCVRSLSRCLAILFAAFLLAAGTGCSSLQSPTAAIQSARMGNVTAEGVTVDLDLLVSNPNPAQLPLGKTSYALSFGNAKVVNGSIDPKTSIPAQGSSRIALPVSLRWDDLLKAQDAIASSLRSGGNVPFSLSGNLGVTGGIPLIGDRGVPLSYQGTLPLGQALKDPGLLLRSPAARALAQRILSGVMTPQ